MVGATGIEPVTPTMSTLRPQRNVRKIRPFSRHVASFPARGCACVHGFGFTRAKEHYVKPVFCEGPPASAGLCPSPALGERRHRSFACRLVAVSRRAVLVVAKGQRP